MNSLLREAILKNSMNKQGSIFYDSAIYLVLLAFFAGGLFALIGMQEGGAAIWEQYYISQIVRVVNAAQPGDTIVLDMQKASEIAAKNDALNKETLIIFSSVEHEVCVKLSSSTKKTCMFYFNDVLVTDVHFAQGVPGNVLSFNVREFNSGGTNE